MDINSMKRMGIAAVLVLGTTTFAHADEMGLDGRWLSRATPASETSDVRLERDFAVPVLTTASLPPRRPKALARTAPLGPKPVVVATAHSYVRIAAAAPLAKPRPLFWMTIGNGF